MSTSKAGSNSSDTDLQARVRQFMDENWNEFGYTVPNPRTYPWLWLWDSCFHSLIWAALGEEQKCLQELTNIFGVQSKDGFVPHMNYSAKPNSPESEWADLWRGRTNSSCITQPPMFGHAIAELIKMGIAIPEEIIVKAQQGLSFLLKHRKRDSKTGLIYLCHPWETGIDNSPRWDDYLEGDFVVEKWNAKKRELLKHIDFNKENSPEFNPAFPVLSVGFNALVAFNILELEGITGSSELSVGAKEITQALEACFNPELLTWVDPSAPSETSSGNVRVLDALFVGLISDSNFDIIEKEINDKNVFGGEYGFSTVHRSEPSFSQNIYWRGSVWPQMMYLFWKMFENKGRKKTATALKQSFLNGVLKSNFSEHWGADTGESLGARPQSWAGLIILTQD